MRINVKVLAAVTALAVLFPARGMAGEDSLMECSRHFYLNGEYYNAVTEAMRYQYLYPRGVRYPESLLLMGRSLYMGGDYSGALVSMEKCSLDYRKTGAGEEAQYLLGRMRLGRGAPVFAIQSFNSYLDIYGDSLYTERVYRDRCYAALLNDDFDRSLKWHRRNTGKSIPQESTWRKWTGFLRI